MESTLKSNNQKEIESKFLSVSEVEKVNKFMKKNYLSSSSVEVTSILIRRNTAPTTREDSEVNSEFSRTSSKHDVHFSPSLVSPRRRKKWQEHLKKRAALDDVQDINEESVYCKIKLISSYQSLSAGTLESSVLLGSDSSYEGEENNDIEKITASKLVDSLESKEEEKTSIFICFLYALINGAIVLPIIMSFGAIIYRDPVFQPYLPTLIKLTVISGMIHQICFSSFSSLKFAVGQVQDAGLIFLAKIASDIVAYLKERDYDDEHILATATIGLSLCTLLLGLGLVIIGHCGLASIVQKLPMPVIGGYLAFIGFFCGQSGLSMMAHENVENILHWNRFFNLNAITLMLPGIFSGLFIFVSVRRIRHMIVLPLCIISLLVIFYAILMIFGTSMDEATRQGWFNEKQSDSLPFSSTWSFLKPSKVVWSALPPCCTITLLGMIFVVALSSSLDVAAIELELNEPLNYDHEIITVGWSNFFSGLTGGYTGSYIFSQSIFSLRAGIKSRACGYFIAGLEFIVVVLPFPILSYVPNFFFGSLLLMICIDLMHEWLWDVKEKGFSVSEYYIAIATFFLISFFGVECGMLLGLIVFGCCYRLGYNVTFDESVIDLLQEKILFPFKNLQLSK